MLQNLNAGSIERFGRLFLMQDISSQNSQTVLAGQEAFRRSDAPVVVAPVKNMSALQLRTIGSETVSFYLDKPVELRSGVQFAVMPLEASCEVVCFSEQPIAVLAEPQPESLAVIRPKLAVRQICTLFRQDRDPGFFFAGERHPAWELVYVLHGSLHTMVGGQDHELHENEALLIAPDMWHVQYGEQDKPVSFIIISFFCDSEALEDLVLRTFPQQQKTIDLMWEILQESRQEKRYQEDILISLLQQLLAQYARCCEEQPQPRHNIPATTRNENQIMDRAVEFIACNTSRRLSIAELARQCNVSPAYLSLLFQRHLNTSPGAYMLRVRLEESCKMIRSGSGTMTQIAAWLRFSSVQHFSAAFKRQYGVNPSAYAKSVAP